MVAVSLFLKYLKYKSSLIIFVTQELDIYLDLKIITSILLAILVIEVCTTCIDFIVIKKPFTMTRCQLKSNIELNFNIYGPPQ